MATRSDGDRAALLARHLLDAVRAGAHDDALAIASRASPDDLARLVIAAAPIDTSVRARAAR